MKVLVTGGDGFIGRWVVMRMEADGFDAVVLDKIGSPKLGHITCDVLDAPALEAAIRSVSPDAVVHLAARTDLDEKSDLAGYAANIDGVRNIVQAIQRTPSIRRAIFTSSQLVCRIGYVPRSDADYCPNTLYGQSKVLTETIVRQYDGGGVEWCLTRPTTVWGPGMRPHYINMLRMIRRGIYFHCGYQKLYKSYGYVENVANQYVRLLKAGAVNFHRKTFYLADTEPLSLRDYADDLAREMAAPKIPSVPLSAVGVLARLGDVVNALGFKRFPFNSFRLNNILTEYRFDMSETIRVCGPDLISRTEGIKRTVRWFASLTT